MKQLTKILFLTIPFYFFVTSFANQTPDDSWNSINNLDQNDFALDQKELNGLAHERVY